MHIKQFSKIKTLNEYDEVEFYGKVTKTIYREDYNQLVVLFFDGYESCKFVVYNGVTSLKKYLTVNNPYLFKGVVRGTNNKYFNVLSVEEVSLSIETEKLLYPERFSYANDNALFIYNNSVTKINNIELRALVADCLGLITDTNPPSQMQESKYRLYLNSPASIRHHDCYSGGYIVHIAGLLLHIDNLESMYVTSNSYRNMIRCNIDFDYLRALAYLHDCGKALTYKRINNSFCWNDDVLLSHAQYGVYIVSNSVYINRINFAMRQKLLKGISEHMNSNSANIPELNIFKSLDSLESACADALSINNMISNDTIK